MVQLEKSNAPYHINKCLLLFTMVLSYCVSIVDPMSYPPSEGGKMAERRGFSSSFSHLSRVPTGPVTTGVETKTRHSVGPPFPKYTSSVIQRNMKSCGQDYFDLANLYSSRNIVDMRRCINTHEDGFKNDNNLGLAKQVLSSLYKRNIQRLTQTYLTLSLQDIADTVQLNGPKEAELHVLQMILDGEIFATINQKDRMLAKKLTFVDEQVLCDQSYLTKIGRDQPRYDPDDFELVPKSMYTSL